MSYNSRSGSVRSNLSNLNADSSDNIVPSQDIIVLSVNMHDEDKDRYIWNTVQALQLQGHNVTVVSDCREAVLPTDCHIVRMGQNIPKTIFGYLRSEMYILRTLYTAFRVASSRSLTGRLVIINSDLIAVPILRFIGGCKTVHLSHYRELFNNANTEVGSWIRRIYNRYLSSYSALVLVPCESALELVTRNGGQLENRLSSLYLPAEGETSPPITPSNFNIASYQFRDYRRNLLASRRSQPFANFEERTHFSFLAVGPFEQKSNFHFLLEAFSAFVNDIELPHHIKITLDITGTCVTREQLDYYMSILAQVENMNRNMNITLSSNPTLEDRSRMYRACNCVLSANMTDLYLESILEAFYFGRLVITTEADFAVKVVEDMHTGIVIPLDVEVFAEVMYDVTFPRGPTYKLMAMEASDHYDDYYSFEMFMYKWNEHISSLC